MALKNLVTLLLIIAAITYVHAITIQDLMFGIHDGESYSIVTNAAKEFSLQSAATRSIPKRSLRGIVREQIYNITWTENGLPAWITVYHYYMNGRGCSAYGTGRCGPVFVYNSGSGCDFVPLAINPDGVNWLMELASNGKDVYTYIPRDMGFVSSPLDGFSFGIDSMVADVSRVIDDALSKNTGVSKVILMGESLGGNVVFRYNRLHGSEKLCLAMESGAPYHTLHPAFMPLLAQMIQMPYPYLPAPLAFNADPVTGMPYPAIGVLGELENEMVHYDMAFNDIIKMYLLTRTPLLPTGPFKNDFANFTIIGYDWELSPEDVPVVVLNGHEEVVNYTPDIIAGFESVPAHDKRIVSFGHGGHMGPWELWMYKSQRATISALIDEYAAAC